MEYKKISPWPGSPVISFRPGLVPVRYAYGPRPCLDDGDDDDDDDNDHDDIHLL